MIPRFLLVIALILALAATAAADTIVLKSGRRIEAWGVEERGDKVYYEGPDGQIAIPKSLVERIERSDALPSWASGGKSSAGLTSAEMPALEDADVARVIAGGKIDRALLGQLEDEANRSLVDPPKQRAAAAHALIGRFYYQRGDLAGAENSLRRALTFEPNHPSLLLNLAVIEAEQQRYPAAQEHLQLVLGQSKLLFEAYRLQGWIYYQTEDMDRAITAWKRALAQHDDSELASLVAKAEKEALVAESYLEHQSGRFVLRYDEGEARGRVGLEVLAALDTMYDELVGTFNFSPREPIVVLLYPQQAFYELTGVPPEVDGLYDGKVRVPIRGLASLTPPLERALRHELVHAFLFFKTRGRAPRWLQEGMAQWLAGQRPQVSLSSFRPLFEPRDGSAVPRIDASFGGEIGQVMGAYYASWLVVDTLEQRYGRGDMDSFFDALGRGESMQQALYTAFRLSYEDLDRDVYDALR